MECNHIFQPITIRGLTLDNRIIMPSMGTLMTYEDSMVTQRMIDYYVERAKGGAGLIFAECAAVWPESTQGFALGISDDKFIPGLTELVDAIHAVGGKIGIQIFEAAEGVMNGHADTSKLRIMSPIDKFGGKWKAIPAEELPDIAAAFGAAARRAAQCGFDAIEIHCGHNYLLHQFLSPHFNTRTDEYGGSLENCMKFPLMCIAETRKNWPADKPLFMRIVAQDDYTYDAEGNFNGLTIDDMVTFCKKAKELGVDVLDVSRGNFGRGNIYEVPNMGLPFGFNKDNALYLKQQVGMPVMAVGRLGRPELANVALAQGADFVAWGHAHIADPYIVQKCKEGRFDDICYCIGCDQACSQAYHIPEARHISCLRNPAAMNEHGLRIEFFGDEIDRISEIDVTSGHLLSTLEHCSVFPATHYATDKSHLDEHIAVIEHDLAERIAAFEADGKLLEAERIAQRTNYDIEMMREIGYCNGIENYSRYFDGRKPGDAPYSLLDYFPKDFLCFIDESHVTVPQIRAMYNGDRARKDTLVEYGFRLPSAYDNRPLLFEEFEQRIKQTIYVSATPGPYEMSKTQQTVEQIIRPTGLLDPEIILRKATGQVDDLVGELSKVIKTGSRVLVTTLTKHMAEDLTSYLRGMDFRVRYLHSDVTTMERMQLIRGLRLGEFDVLVGINLLREGLDLPEVALVAILDADKEGFLRSETSLVQTIGRAARNVDGRVIMYADIMTDSMFRAISETNRRRAIQQEYNRIHGITPETVRNAIHNVLEITKKVSDSAPATMSEDERSALMRQIEDQMLSAAKALNFEEAAKLRDRLLALKGETPEPAQEQKKRRRTRSSTRHH